MTEVDLRHSLVPDDVIAELVKSMPPHAGPMLKEDRDAQLRGLDYISFMENYTDNGNGVNGANGVH